jgi:hypothetical protein
MKTNAFYFILLKDNVSTALSFYSQVLIVFSTSDYLVNYVLYFTMDAMQLILDAIIRLKEELGNERVTENEHSTKMLQAQTLIYNCRLLTTCIESIIKIRNLENYTTITTKLKLNMNSILNTIFIKLSNVHPLLAIEISKLIQLLTLKTD